MKKIETGEQVRNSVIAGAIKLAEIIEITLGPKCKNVMIKSDTGPMIVNDGYTIAMHTYLPDQNEDLGCQSVKETCFLTNALAGDGTTTSIVLVKAILEYFMSISEDEQDQINVITFKDEMTKLVADLIKYLESIKRNVNKDNDTDILNIAKISCGGNLEAAQLIVSAFNAVGRVGRVVVKSPRSYKMEMIPTKGMIYDQGYVSKYFVNKADKKSPSVFFENAFIAYVQGELVNAVDVLQILETAFGRNKKVLIMADDIKGQALGVLIENAGMCCAVITPGKMKSERIEFIEDMIAITGGKVMNLDETTQDAVYKCNDQHLGLVDSVEVFGDRFILERAIDNENRETYEARVKYLDEKIAKHPEEFFLDMYQNRRAKLIGGLAVIYPGNRSELVAQETKLRIEDAINSVRVALENGYVPGGGTAFNAATKILQQEKNVTYTLEQKHARIALTRALNAPMEQIIKNAGKDLKEIVTKIHDAEKVAGDFMGYDAKNDIVVAMMKEGIIDPFNVSIAALENSVAVSGIVLTTGGTITPLPTANERAPLFDFGGK